MAFTEDAVKAKLSALNETQDSIVSVAQWILFHRRHAPVTAKIWQARLGDSQAPKRLNLIYLANEVIQQSKARKKDDFLLAFSPIIADATVTAFKGASGEIQQKIRRVVDVWRQRNIFDPSVQEGIEKRVDAIESGRRKPMLGGSLFGGGGGGGAEVPTELSKLAELQMTVTKSELAIKPAASSSLSEYKSLISPGPDADQQPTALPKQAAQLAALQKSLASASDAVSASIAARKALVAELSRLVEQHQEATRQEEKQLQDLTTKRPEVEERRRHVEDQIMRGLGEEEEDSASKSEEAQRPEMEPLTPPPVESFTPPPAAPPPTGAAATGVDGIDGLEGTADGSVTPPGDPSAATTADPRPVSSAGTKRESSGALAGLNGASNSTIKRRKMSHQAESADEVYAGLEDDELDDEVKDMLA